MILDPSIKKSFWSLAEKFLEPTLIFFLSPPNTVCIMLSKKIGGLWA